ncbi:MAG: hypothetical protein ACE5D8_00880 [Fidelibacterota bacterium]
MSRNKHRRSRTRHGKSLWEEFRTEFFIAFLFLLGVFLLVEEMEIKQTIFLTFKTAIQWVAREINAAARFVAALIQEVETSDIVGLILIFIAIALMGGRLRQKIIHRYEHLYSCPQCGDELHRIHRRLWHKILQLVLFIRVKHYTCKKCDFHGIQILDR